MPAVKADLALRAVADGGGDRGRPRTDIDAEIERHGGAATRSNRRELRAQLERADQMPAVRSDLRKSKALEWLVEHVEVVDEEGHPIDRALLEPLNAPRSRGFRATTEPVSQEPSESGEA